MNGCASGDVSVLCAVVVKLEGGDDEDVVDRTRSVAQIGRNVWSEVGTSRRHRFTIGAGDRRAHTIAGLGTPKPSGEVGCFAATVGVGERDG